MSMGYTDRDNFDDYDDNNNFDHGYHDDDNNIGYEDGGAAPGEKPAAESKPSEPLKYSGTFIGEYTEDYQAAVLEQIRLAKVRRARADKRARDKLHAEIVMITAAVIAIVLVSSVIIHIGKRKRETQAFVMEEPDTVSSQAEAPVTTTAPPKEVPPVEDVPYANEAKGHELTEVKGVYYVDGILIVNKTFPLPKDYDPGISQEAENAFYAMAGDAWTNYGIGLWQVSGYRSYDEQEQLFSDYAAERGLTEADEVSARAGHSEHQAGLSYDVNSTDFSFAGTMEAQWLEQHCAEFGFIIRFPQGKESITGYDYEPWHIRYVGVEHAQKMKASGQCLEEYLNVTSKYENCPTNEEYLKAHEKYKNIKPADSSETAADNGYDYGYDYGYGY